MPSEQDAQSFPRAASDLSPELADLAVRAVGHSFIVTDLSGTILLWNRGAEELYGWSAADATGMPITALLVPPSAEADATAILAPLASGRPWSGEFPVRHETGRVFLARISTWPMRDGTGRIIGFVGLSEEARTDSEDRALVRELAGALRRLLPEAAVGGDPRTEPAEFDADATAIEIVTRASDLELRAAANADPHGTVLPADGLTLAQLDDLLASLVALAVHTTNVAAEWCGLAPEDVVAAAALRLRHR